MVALSHLESDAELDDEITRIRAVLANLRRFAKRPWNEQQGQKLRWQVRACERHLARLERRRGTA